MQPLNKERTMVLLKPDAIARGLTEAILCRLSELELKIIECREIMATRSLVMRLYNKNGAWREKYGQEKIDEMVLRGETPQKTSMEYGQDILDSLYDFMTSGPMVLIILEGECAVARTKALVGASDPKEAASGTIRGDLGDDSIMDSQREGRAVRNLVHCSASIDASVHEIYLWFRAKNFVKQ